MIGRLARFVAMIDAQPGSLKASPLVSTAQTMRAFQAGMQSAITC